MARWSYRQIRELVRGWPCMRHGRDPCFWLSAVAHAALATLAWFTQWLFVFAILFTLFGGVRVFVRGLEIRSEGSTRVLAALLIVPSFLLYEGLAYLKGAIDKKYPESQE